MDRTPSSKLSVLKIRSISSPVTEFKTVYLY